MTTPPWPPPSPTSTPPSPPSTARPSTPHSSWSRVKQLLYGAIQSTESSRRERPKSLSHVKQVKLRFWHFFLFLSNQNYHLRMEWNSNFGGYTANFWWCYFAFSRRISIRKTMGITVQHGRFLTRRCSILQADTRCWHIFDACRWTTIHEQPLRQGMHKWKPSFTWWRQNQRDIGRHCRPLWSVLSSGVSLKTLFLDTKIFNLMPLLLRMECTQDGFGIPDVSLGFATCNFDGSWTPPGDCERKQHMFLIWE